MKDRLQVEDKSRRPPTSFSATLRIFGVYHLHQIISQELGQPTMEHRKGESAQKRFPYLKTTNYTNDAWLLTAPVEESTALVEHIDWLLELVSNHKPLFEKIRQDQGVLDICCSLTLRGEVTDFAISQSEMQILSERGIPISFLIIRGAS